MTTKPTMATTLQMRQHKQQQRRQKRDQKHTATPAARTLLMPTPTTRLSTYMLQHLQPQHRHDSQGVESLADSPRSLGSWPIILWTLGSFSAALRCSALWPPQPFGLRFNLLLCGYLLTVVHVLATPTLCFYIWFRECRGANIPTQLDTDTCICGPAVALPLKPTKAERRSSTTS